MAVSTSGSSFDTVLAVFTGTAVDSLVPVAGACNDDADGTLQSRVSFTATAGTTYYFEIGGFSAYGNRAATGDLVLNVTGTQAPIACSPRPKVNVTVARTGDGRLQVTVTAGSGTLQRVRFGTDRRPATNALVEWPGRFAATAPDMTVPLPGTTTTETFFIRRGAPGTAATVPLVITDGCGEWETFVGGGPNAF